MSPVRDRSANLIPWPVRSMIAAVSLMTFGIYWDISWHQSIGRDSVWAWPHLAVYFGAVLAGLTGAVVIAADTLRPGPQTPDRTIALFGLRGPFGAFAACWACLLLLAGAVFDDWWHGAYGIDARINSPPHEVLGSGMQTAALAGMILTVGASNRAEGAARAALERVFLYLSGLLLILLMMKLPHYAYSVFWGFAGMRLPEWYAFILLASASVLAASGRASRRPWAATTVAAVYGGLWLAALWLLPLFPATPRLGPIYTRITHMVPLGFPVLLVAPALAMDLLLRRFGAMPRRRLALLMGGGALAVLACVQWPLAGFLVSPAAGNWVFGAHYVTYRTLPSTYHLAYELQPFYGTWGDWWLGWAAALMVAVSMSWLGLALGDWMRSLRR